MSTAVPCIDRAGFYVEQMMLPNMPARGVKGALEELRKQTGVSFWKLRKLYNPTLRRYGLSLLAEEWESIKAAYERHVIDHEVKLTRELEQLRALKASRQQRGLFDADTSAHSRAMAPGRNARSDSD